MKANAYDKVQASDVAQPNELGKPRPQKTNPPAKADSAKWFVAAIILLSAIPLAAGVFRLIQLASGAEITPANARFFASPLPVVIHIVNAGVYALLGVFQFVNRFRQRRPGWHRVAGRFLVACGLLVGLSGLWMTLFYPYPKGASDLLYVLRLFFGFGMVLSIILGFISIRRRDIIQHRAWMTRAYAIGLGAGTQVLTGIVGALILGKPNEFENALLMGAAWVINLAIAEWIIRKRPAPRTRAAPTIVSQLQ